MPILTIYDQLTRDEGVALHPYTDTRGNLTIGIGRNLAAKGITLAEAHAMLTDDVHEVAASLLKVLPWFATLSDVRAGVLLNMAFNLGVGGLVSFHNALSFMEAGRWDDAAAAILKSEWATQVGQRATRLAEQLKTNKWQ